MIFSEKDFEVEFGHQKIEKIIEAKKNEADKRLEKAKEKAYSLMREIEALDLDLDYLERKEDRDTWEEESIREEIEKKQEAICSALMIA